jgi:hypothetical protein
MSGMKAALIGALAALAVVAVLLILVFTGVVHGVGTRGGDGDGSVAVGLVLPGSDGAMALRVLDVYTRDGSGWSVKSVAPSSPVIVSGTGGSTLVDAYSFGGGGKLADTLRTQLNLPIGGWVMVDERAWLALRSGARVPVDLPRPVAAFDGSTLSSYAEGVGDIPPQEMGVLLDGAAYLSASDSRDVRAQVGDALSSSLASAGPTGVSGLQSSLSASAFSAWISGLRHVRRVPGS